MGMADCCFVLQKDIRLHVCTCGEKEQGIIKETNFVDSTKKAVRNISKHISMAPVDIIFYFSSRNIIPETGESGHAINEKLIMISADPSRKGKIDFIVQKRLPKTLAHELHHVARMKTVGYGKTLFETMVTEGLADHFADLLYPTPESPWTKALTPEEEMFTWERARKFLNKSYNHAEWFFGKGSIPRWAGYTLGYKLVGKYLEDHPDKNPCQLYKANAKQFEIS